MTGGGWQHMKVCDMRQTITLSPVRYITEENGQRVGVVLDWEDYQSLKARFPVDPDLLPGLSEEELRVLAEGMLSLQRQERLHKLLHGIDVTDCVRITTRCLHAPRTGPMIRWVCVASMVELALFFGIL